MRDTLDDDLVEACNVLGLLRGAWNAFPHNPAPRRAIWRNPPVAMLRHWARVRLGWDNATFRRTDLATTRSLWRTLHTADPGVVARRDSRVRMRERWPYRARPRDRIARWTFDMISTVKLSQTPVVLRG